MKHGSLFSGIGGFDLAASWMGWDNVFHCEIDKFCQKVLNYYWPNAISYEDIKTTDFTIHRGQIDILTGGFPCQPFSQAGKRKGTGDNRYLWLEMLRAIREIQPRYIVGENVRGLTNWNGGLVFDQVQADLEAEGYEVLPFLLPACAVNAPHRRDRIWFVANRNTEQREWKERGFQSKFKNGSNGDAAYTERNGSEEKLLNESGETQFRGCNKPITTNTDSSKRLKGGLYTEGQIQAERHIGSCDTWSNRGNWQDFPTFSPICTRDDGFPGQLANISFPRWRNESIKGLGNAVVPQLVYEIFKAIENNTLVLK